MKLLKYLPIALVAVLLCLAGWSLLTYEDNQLWKLQELNLFMDTSLFFKQQLVVPGGLLTYLGTYFTQYFFYAWQGVLIVCAWWMLLVWLSAKALKVPMKWCLLLAVPVALLLAANMQMGYWIYYMKLRGYFFVPTIALTAGMAVLWGWRLMPRMVRLVMTAVLPLALYPLLGAYGLLIVLLMGVLVWRLDDATLWMRLTTTVVALVAVIVVPRLFYAFVYYQTNLDYIYMSALPMFQLEEQYNQYYLPFILIGVSYVVMALPMPQQIEKLFNRLPLWLGCQVLLVAVCVMCAHHFWYHDANFEKELQMRRAMDNSQWEDMLRAAANLDEEPTRAIVMMKNLALFRLGRQGDEMYHYRTGAKKAEAPFRVYMTQVVGCAIYYQYGQANYCYRWCLEDGVEYGWRAEYLKLMTRCALVNGEYEVARKYINLLKHTRFHRDWALQQEAFVNHPEKMKTDKDYAIIRRLLMKDDHLGTDNGMIEMYLMSVLMDINTKDPLVQELTLLSAMWKKDIALFWPRFFNYASLHPGERMPKHYQEAAYLYGHLEHQVDISHMPFDDDVKKNYDEFMKMAQQYAGLSEEQMKPIFYPRFGRTFYYEYFLIRNQKIY